MKKSKLLVLLLALSVQVAGAQIVTDLILEAAEAAAAQKLKETFINPLGQQDTADVDGEGWDEHFRTSDMEGEQSTQYWSRRDPPPQGVRVGCICMDGSRNNEASTGACSGYGGVRYWLYQISPDSIAWFPTQRHWQHPEELSDTELANLASRHRREKYGASNVGGSSSWGLYHTLSVLIVCMTMAYIAKLWFETHDKLPD